ncbi:uncharacterized protein LOC119996939 [Tripterygium wilfordii]|uniref:uncharacterized protein LOC119996939 n=1 Tax=Tripterygium wilfordii TaxID=458696 RepID=UPI0018F860D2|nr:uncharacterized protein LOC119996939 [Tripterygium wilfordii]
MDKSWVHLNKGTPEYEKGMDTFLDIAFSCEGVTDKIRCPCCKCNNVYFKDKSDVKFDLFRWGMEKSYTKWIYHGESLNDVPIDDGVEANDDNNAENDDAATFEMLYNMSRGGGFGDILAGIGEHFDNCDPEQPNEEAKKFYQLLKDAEQKLYPNFDKGLNGLLDFIRFILPPDNTCPASMREARKMVSALGLMYKKIDACVNDCVLFCKENSVMDQCPECGEARWQKVPEVVGNEVPIFKKKKKRVPRKLLRYFPLKPRLQQLFMSKETASAMRWHRDERENDGILRHPADSKEWKDFDDKHPSFAIESRNVRLGLASDGFNPFGTMSISHSTWPVVMIPYNLPPWLCMKHSYWMLCLLIPGPKSPGNDIDIYLAPLIDDLKDLWEVGIQTFDASLQQNFQLRAMLLWTINDFPAYAMMSGWSTKGELACPCCNKNTCSYRLKHGRKHCYMGHRRSLSHEHPWRKNRRLFDNHMEHR